MSGDDQTLLPNSRAKITKGDDIFLVTLQCDSEEQAEELSHKLAALMFKDAITGRSRVKRLTLRKMNWFKRLNFLFLWEKYEVLKIR